MDNKLSELKKKGEELKGEADKFSKIMGSSSESERSKEKSEQSENEKMNTSTKLVRLVEEACIDLFHSPEGRTFATLPIKDHQETWPISGKGFKNWLKGAYWKKYKIPANSQAVTDALGVLQAKAQFEGEEDEVFTRIGCRHRKVFMYLAGPDGRIVEISTTGWRICDESEVHFIKTKNLAKMPEPEHRGDIEALREFINIEGGDNDSWYLTVAWLVAAFLEGPYTILVVVGEAGCAKTTFARILTRLVDPFEGDLRSFPRNERDLMISAVNGWVLAFDNVSGVPVWLSDAFCRLATGGGFSTRELYTDSEETIFKAKRPIILNGIDDMASRGDLIARTILLTLFPIKETIDEDKFWGRFERARPKIFGALLDILSKVLSILPTLEVSNLPRMADFARVGVAVEKVLNWQDGCFLRAYRSNRDKSSALPLESLFAEAIIKFMSDEKSWEGSASDLLSELNELVDKEKRQNLKDWPKTPEIVGNRLRRLAPNLRTIGLDIQWDRAGRKRIIKITREDRAEKLLSQASRIASQQNENQICDGDDSDDGLYKDLTGSLLEGVTHVESLDLKVRV